MPIDLTTNQKIEKNKLTTTNVELILIDITYEDEPTIRICLNNAEIEWNGNTYYPAIFSLTGLQETKEAEVPKVSLSFTDFTFKIIPILEEYGGAVGAKVIIRVVDSLDISNTTPKLEENLEILDSSVDDSANVSLNLGIENLTNLRIPRNRYLKNNCRYDFKVAVLEFNLGNTSSGLAPIVGDKVYGRTSLAWGRILRVEVDSGIWNGTAMGRLKIAYSSISVAGMVADEFLSHYSASDILLNYSFGKTVTAPIGRCNYTGTETSCDRSLARCIELDNQARFGGFPGIGAKGYIA